ncbi:MAG TPA: hypothetical protein VHB77_18880 [Planctomycetaceae bacterium]|jgi:hypothetical protein|nr:hypothetical protein [Planctomycetaceae bacterium]
MGRRNKSEEINIGSDSFMDVIANMVGILIILIVIAGLRVSQQPRVRTPTAAIPGAIPVTEPVAAPAPLPEPTEPESAEPDPELIARVRQLERELAEAEQELTTSQEALRVLDEQRRKESLELAAAEDTLSAKDRDLKRFRHQIGDMGSRVNAKREAFALLKAELAKLEKDPPKVSKVKHRVTPISRTVDGDELHFRLSENKVAVVPLDDLIARLKRQIETQREVILRHSSYEGVVGPLDGFTLTFRMQRRPLSAVQQLQYGSGGFAVKLTGYKIVPEPELRSEDYDQASRVGSQLHTALISAKPGATLTFWVYPDSYELYRKLQELAHDAGFQVAARPLPMGTPIAGSPDGSRSAGQ